MSTEDLDEYLVEELGEDHAKDPKKYRFVIKTLKQNLDNTSDHLESIRLQISDLYKFMTGIDIEVLVKERLCAHCFTLCQLCGSPTSDLDVSTITPGKWTNVVVNDEKW
jgi:hypothetical protein